MGKFVVGEVVAIPFPFSNLSGNKLRPALVLAVVEHNDLILCQITSKAFASKRAISISSGDFETGDLPLKSYVRPEKLFTAESTLIRKTRGKLSSKKLEAILVSVQSLFDYK